MLKKHFTKLAGAMARGLSALRRRVAAFVAAGVVAALSSSVAFAAAQTVNVGGFVVTYDDANGVVQSVNASGTIGALAAVFIGVISVAFAMFLWRKFGLLVKRT